jgi:hypothetical protein
MRALYDCASVPLTASGPTVRLIVAVGLTDFLGGCKLE